MAVAPFPADDPIWNTGGANRTTPLVAKQILGWEFEDEPPSGYFNWFMFYVGEYIQHYKVAVVALDTNKVDRAGDAALSGVFLPTADLGATFGSKAKRLSGVFANGLTGQFILPMNPIGAQVGDPGDLFASGWFAAMNISMSIAPLSVASAFNGSDVKPWSTVVARTMSAKSFRPTSLNYTQASAASLFDLVKNKSVVAAAAIAYPGGVPSEKTGAGASFNIVGASRTSGGASFGDITILLQQPIAVNSIVLATMSDPSFTGSAKALDAAVVAGGGAIRVRIRTVASSPAFVDEEFSVIAVGLPFTAVADPIL